MSERIDGVAITFVAVWLGAVAMGIAGVAHYKSTPGIQADAPAVWPRESRVHRDLGMPTLVMFAHPRCPCTRASLTELAVLMESLRGKVTAVVILLHPEGTDDAWKNTDLRERAASIAGVEVVDDPGGEEAALFGTVTSGQALLYEAGGRLAFRGGITLARGHEGDSPGRARIASLVLAGAAEHDSAPVFGCSLLDRPREARSR